MLREVLNKPLIRDTACKTNDSRVPQGTISAASGIHLVKDLSHGGAMTCNLCLELDHSPLQSHQTRFIQHFLRKLPNLFAIILGAYAFAAPALSYAGITLHAAGSTTVLPVVSTAANIYHQQHPDVTITVSGGGSGVGIASMIQGTADIGMASREIDAEEATKLAGRVDVFTIARDAVAVVVSKAVYVGGVHQLSLKQIADIYRGKIKNWKKVGGPDARIFVIDKEASRGTRHVFAEAVLGDAHARAPGASVISGSNNEEQSLVAHSDSAIGMLSNAWLNDAVRGVAVGKDNHAVSPDIQHVRDGSYPISRSLHVILLKKAPPEARAFVDFLLSPRGQEIVKQSGYLPVR